MKTLVEITSDNFQELVLNSDKPVFVDFWATWCPPCKRITPFVEELADDYEGKAVVGKLDIDNSPDLAMKFGVNSVPTLMVFKNGEPVETQLGAVPKDYMAEMLDRHLG